MLVFVSDSIDLDLNCCSFRESGHFLSFEKVDELYLKMSQTLDQYVVTFTCSRSHALVVS